MFVSFFLEGRGPALHYCASVPFSPLPADAVMGNAHHQGVGSGPSTVSLSLFSASQLPCMTKSALFFLSYFITYIFLSIPAVRHKLETFFALQRGKKRARPVAVRTTRKEQTKTNRTIVRQLNTCKQKKEYPDERMYGGPVLFVKLAE